MKIVADNKIPFLRGVFEPFAEVVYLPGAKTAAADVADADALITRTRTKCSRELLSGSRVKIVATATIGFDHIDAAALSELGIPWCNAPGCNANSVGQYLSTTLAGCGRPLAGKTLGVIGVGHVGTIVARYGELLGLRVLRNDPPRAEKESGFVGLEELLAESDFVTMHVPLVHDGPYPTFHLADGSFFERLKRGAFFINSSRGEAADTGAVKAALRSGRIDGAVIDVWENEPDIDRELMGATWISTPHIAGYSIDGKANGTAASVQAVARKLGIRELEHWRPESLPPPPEGAEIELPETGAVAAALLHTYDARNDSARLRANPENFEELRGSYPVRREFGAFRLHGGNAADRERLAEFGFHLA